MAVGYGNDGRTQRKSIKFTGNAHFISPPTVDKMSFAEGGLFHVLISFQVPAALEAGAAY